ncbi:PD-(D/E)XK nuclease family protein [candidate division WOR-3 bacterium]|nr:PD-(D/E)XK nuclease family protein [candidate division WOR-3 bacterium]
MIDHISTSQIQSYLHCPLKYRFYYIDQIPVSFKPSGLAFGSVIHSSLEWLHKKLLAGKRPKLEELWHIFQIDWSAQKLDNIHYRNGEKEENLLAMGKNLLSLYFKNSSGIKVKSTEMPFEVPLINAKTSETLDVPLRGIIDLIEDGKNGETIVDFKTSIRALNGSDVERNLQLTAYSYAYWVIYQREPKLRIDNLVKNRKPKIERIEAQRTRKDHLWFFNLSVQVLRGIKEGIFFPNPSWMCNDCEYADICKEWKG